MANSTDWRIVEIFQNRAFVDEQLLRIKRLRLDRRMGDIEEVVICSLPHKGGRQGDRNPDVDMHITAELLSGTGRKKLLVFDANNENGTWSLENQKKNKEYRTTYDQYKAFSYKDPQSGEIYYLKKTTKHHLYTPTPPCILYPTE
ncbi:hypothetical protein CC1G_12592 [Coprinopsis cinerea okayama7|uniref:Uncharacterized protein n=1 Tax=Coprinopsis cinerea (strain Okayama-7 / 130 / ATCC MYA-4618 / FGSC 9003) TaxID=240176 RepID=A8P9K1_COPC7|nr:hypothetical protein CC1G_12592 [Coprinopsis cinerea okayama7\|eukprot:XP_001839790.2 hypothetical protein CC1G_12592 [Coprinopsis cinerea okayama7\